MARERPYTVECHNINIAAGQDVLALYAGNKSFALVGFTIGQITKTTIESLQLSIKLIPATVTPGSGGASATPRQANPSDVAATVTARRNDTVQATSSGTIRTLFSDTINVVNGYSFFWPEDFEPGVDINQAIVLSLDTADGAGLATSATLFFEELV